MLDKGFIHLSTLQCFGALYEEKGWVNAVMHGLQTAE